jgi:outer membrane protein assembly factor BamB
MKKSTALPIVLSLVVLPAAAFLAADGPEVPVRWGGSSTSNMVSAARDLPADPGAVAPLWEIKLGSHQYTIPTIDRGRIYIGADDAGLERPGVKVTGGGIVVCADVATGKVLWTFVSPRYMEGVKAPYHFDQWKCGICSGPVVDGGRVYMVGNRGEVLCLDREGQANGNEGPFLDELKYMGAEPGTALLPTDGDIVWKYDLLKDDKVIPHDVCGSTILLQGDLLWACTSNGIDDLHAKIPSPLAPSLVVLDKRTGRLVARDGEEIGRRTLHGHWSSPALGSAGGKPLVFFGGGDGVLYAFEPPDPAGAGQVLRRVWSHDCNPPEYRTRDGKPLPYSRSNENRPDGPSEIIGTPVFHEGRVFVTIGQSPIHGAGQGNLSCLDAATGAKVWSSTLVDRTLATPAIAGGLVFVPDYTGNLHAFDAASGERLWVHPLGGKTWGSSAFAADGKVYVGTEANVLWVLEAARQLKVLARTRWKSVPITSAAADGVLFVPTQKSLIAVPGKGAAAPEGKP